MIYDNIIIIFKIILLSWFIFKFDPFKWILEDIRPKTNKTIINLIFDILNQVINCMKCLSFWIGLIAFQSLWLALIASYLSFVYYKLLGRWEEEIIVNNGSEEETS